MSDAGIVIPVKIEGEGSTLTLEQLAAKMREVGRAADETNAKLKQKQGGLESLGKTALAAAATYLSFRAALGFVTDSLKAQSEAEANVNKLNLALANQGNLTEQTSKNLRDYASALQETTTFSDDAVLASEAILASFGLTEEQIIKTQGAAADFAAATGKSLTDATQALAKASTGNVTALQKLGFTFTEGATDAQKFQEALDQVNKRFGGSAVAATKTFEGAVAQLSNQWGEAQEAFGRFLATLVGGTSGFEGVINFVKRLTKFLGSDLIIALSEARALFAEFVGFLATKVAVVLDLLGKLPDRLGGAAFREAAETARAVAEGQTQLATELRAAGDAAATSGGNFQTFTNSVGGAGDAAGLTAEQVKELAKATESAGQTIAKAQEAISKGLAEGIERNLPEVDAAFAKIARESAKAAADVQAAVTKAFEKVPGGVPPEVQAQVDALAKGWKEVQAAQEAAALDEARVRAFGEGVREADLRLNDIVKTFDLLKGADPFAGQSSAAVAAWAQSVAEGAAKGTAEAAAKVGPAFASALGRLIPEDIDKLSSGALATLEEQLVGLEKSLRNVPSLAKEWDTVATSLGNVREAQRDVYGEGLEQADKVEKETTDLTDATDAWGEAIQSVEALMSALGISSDSTLGKIVGSLGGVTSGFKGLASGLKGLGAEGGGGFLSGLTGALGKAGAIGSIAASAIAIGSSIVKLFQGDPIKKAQKEAAKILGTGISRELAEEIKKNADKLGIAIKDAALLALPKAIEESGKSAASFAGQAAELIAKVASGAVPAKEGLEAIGQTFSKITDEAIKAGEVGSAAVRGLIRQARASGVEVPEIKAFVGEQLDKAIAGVGKFIDALSAVSEEGLARLAEDSAAIFGATFAAAVSEKGVVGAVDALSGSFDKLRTQLSETLGADTAAQLLAPFSAAFDLLGNEALRPLVEGIDGLGQALTGLANSDFLDANTFTAIQRSAGTLFDELIAGGADTRTSLLTIAPTIQAAITAAENFGLPLDENTLRLKELAEQNGIAFKTDPQAQMLEVLVAIADVFGAKIPESIRATQGALTSVAQQTKEQFGSAGEAAKDAFEDSVAASKAAGQGLITSIGPAFKAADAAGKEWLAAHEENVATFTTTMTTTVPDAILTSAESFNTLGTQGDETWAALDEGALELAGSLTTDVPAAAATALAALQQLQGAAAAGVSVGAAPGGVPEIPGAPGAPTGVAGASGTVNQNTINLTVQQNPFQSQEGQEATRRLILATVEDAVANLETQLGG